MWNVNNVHLVVWHRFVFGQKLPPSLWSEFDHSRMHLQKNKYFSIEEPRFIIGMNRIQMCNRFTLDDCALSVLFDDCILFTQLYCIRRIDRPQWTLNIHMRLNSGPIAPLFRRMKETLWIIHAVSSVFTRAHRRTQCIYRFHVFRDLFNDGARSLWLIFCLAGFPLHHMLRSAWRLGMALAKSAQGSENGKCSNNSIGEW